MTIWGKVIGGVAGFALGGPFGALLGAYAGHTIDRLRDGEDGGGPWAPRERRPAGVEDRQVVFTTAIIVLAAKLAKVDGRVTRDEIGAFKRIFHIPPHEMANVARIYDQAKGEATGFEPYARQLALLFGEEPEVIEELMAALFHVALADGGYHPAERQFLVRVAAIFGFDAHAFARLEQMFAEPKAADPFDVLGIARNAAHAEIKKTYRRLIRENHPDALVAKGLPKELIALANEKMAAINAAYERVRKERGIK